MSKPKKFAVVIYENPNLPVMKTAWDGNEGNGLIVTHRYCLDINYEISEKVKDKIQKSIQRFLTKY